MTGLRIGIDVGGTNTDAVLMSGAEVLGWTKRPTTADVTGGIHTALQQLLDESRVAPREIAAVMLGTTHFTNAVVQRRDLVPTAVLRLCLPAAQAVMPLFDWPDDLRAAIGGQFHLLHGGHEYDGREISPLDAAELDAALRQLSADGVGAVAIASIFSPVTASHEAEVARRVREILPEVAITLSHAIGRLGLLERENAAVLNACLTRMAGRTIAAFREALERLGLQAEIYLSQNDGTLMSAEFAERYPVLTFASGPTNSMRGAAFLSGLATAVVVDVGGTTTDVGMLVAGFPREASFAVHIGGVRTNFRMPDLISIGLGGGSIVEADGQRVGPLSVGYELIRRGLVFGGDTLTATDIAVAAGQAAIGDPTRAAVIDPVNVHGALETIRETLEQVIDAAKTSADPLPVIAVGGGSILIPEQLAGVSEVLRPPHYEVANAIGAAIAQVSGEIDRIYSMDNRTRASVLEQARDEATAQAAATGADPASIEIVEVDEIPLAYLPSNALRVRVKAVGNLKA
jgi:N-methylhydantoinase A/oxoprolinase/acetone carboxylase beta subunit